MTFHAWTEPPVCSRFGLDTSKGAGLTPDGGYITEVWSPAQTRLRPSQVSSLQLVLLSWYFRVDCKPLVNMSESGTCTSIINLRYQDGSEGSPSNPAKFKSQDYAQLKDYCLRRGKLFVDNTFPPDSRSLGDLPNLSVWQEDDVKWLRPAVKCFWNTCYCLLGLIQY